MTADQEFVARFSQTNPGPTGSHERSRERSATGRPDGDVAVLDFAPDRTADRRAPPRHARWLLGSAAALVLLLLILILTDDGEQDERAVDRSPDAARPAVGGEVGTIDAAMVERAESFVDAYSAFDADAAMRLASPAAVIDGLLSTDLATELGWRQVVDWTARTIECGPVGENVRCSYRVDDRLTRLHDVQVAGDMEFRFDAQGRVEHVEIEEDLLRYGARALKPFLFWVASEHPDDLSRIWDVEGVIGPRLDEDALALAADRLEEYAAGADPPLGAHQAFFRARASGDAATLSGLLSPDAVVRDSWIDDPADYPGLLAFFDATGWTWDPRTCLLDDPGGEGLPVVVVCTFEVRAGWSSAGLNVPHDASIRVGTMGGSVMEVEVDYDTELVDRRLAPWFDWLEREHTDDVGVMYTVTGDRYEPTRTPGALALFEERVVDFVATAE